MCVWGCVTCMIVCAVSHVREHVVVRAYFLIMCARCTCLAVGVVRASLCWACMSWEAVLCPGWSAVCRWGPVVSSCRRLGIHFRPTWYNVYWGRAVQSVYHCVVC